MRTRTKNRVLALVFLFAGAINLGTALVLGVFVASWWAEKCRASAIECVLEWGRLAPFPSSAQEVTVTATGTMFNRGFRASFVAPPEDIEGWLAVSPGTREVVETTPSPGVRHFKIKPGGGAWLAEVSVNDAEHRVSVFVEWS